MNRRHETNYSEKSGEFYNLVSTQKNHVPEISFMEKIKLIKTILMDTTRTPRSKLPEVRPDMAEFLKHSAQIKFIWFGHSTLLLNIDGKIVLIDPVFGGHASPFSFLVKRFQAPVLKLEELPHVDVIVISHNHYDHLDKSTINYFKHKTTGFIVPLGVGADLEDWGVKPSRIVELNWGESVSHNGIHFTATPAQHFSGRGFFDRNKTLWASWVIKGKAESIFFSGDSGYGDHFKEIGLRYGPFDVTFIENGQYNERWPDVHMQPEETIQAHLDLNGKLFVPIHWGMFDLALHNWAEPVERSYKIATAWDIPVFVPKLGQVVDIGVDNETTPWWHEEKKLITEGVLTPALNL